jgi:formylglycine-generating enzyme required for sulfatase activity
MKKWRKGLLIGLAAVGLSTLGIQASDVLRGLESNMLGSVIDSGGPCGPHAEQLLLGGRTLCIDTYEASPGDTCPHTAVSGQTDTANNVISQSCIPVTEPEREPWRYVSLTEAQQLCARTGKRLPTNEEWYKAVSGITNIGACVTDGDEPLLTGQAGCIAPLGTHDLVGNVWEWLDEEVTDGAYNQRSMPSSGYVIGVDTDGVVSATADQADSTFGDDYAWTNNDGVRAMIRGGFYGSGSDAGIYALNSAVDTNFRAVGVGFRCVKDL